MSIRREGYGRPVIICTAGDDSIAVFFSLSLVRYATTLAAERERIYNNFRRSLTRAPGGKQMVVVVVFFSVVARQVVERAKKENKGYEEEETQSLWSRHASKSIGPLLLLLITVCLVNLGA